MAMRMAGTDTGGSLGAFGEAFEDVVAGAVVQARAPERL
jgi:hypothetical protein